MSEPAYEFKMTPRLRKALHDVRSAVEENGGDTDDVANVLIGGALAIIEDQKGPFAAAAWLSVFAAKARKGLTDGVH